MLRKLTLILLMVVAWQGQAVSYQCQVSLQDDIFITAQQVNIVGASGNLVITPDGSVSRNGKNAVISDAVRLQAKSYQADLRRELPKIQNGIQQRLTSVTKSLDNVVVEQLGKESNTRVRLTKLNQELQIQLDRVLEVNGDKVSFNHQMIKQVEIDGRNIIEQSLGGILQDSINEFGSKQVRLDNLLAGLIGNLGGLQQTLKTEWNKQEVDLVPFAKQACSQIIALEQQLANLLQALPQ